MVDEINRVWKEKRGNLLMYADDTVIMEGSERELEEKINVLVVSAGLWV